MASYDITILRPYPFQMGEKIRIEGGSREGDWEVIGLSEAKVTLRCPISQREFEWDRFCYFLQHCEQTVWPKENT